MENQLNNKLGDRPSMNIVAELERRFLPHLQRIAAKLQTEFPKFQITTWSSPTGSLTEYQGHDLGIDCVLPDAPPDQPYTICLIIGVMHLTTSPEICDAEVSGGPGTPGTELSLLDAPIPFSLEALEWIEAQLSRLVEVLRTALQRWHPLELDSR